MARGNGSNAVFVTHDDRKVFLHRLGQVCESHNWKVHARVLMEKLFHLRFYFPLWDKGDAEAMKSARAAIEDFWRIRLLEIPASETYRHWQKEWESLFP